MKKNTIYTLVCGISALILAQAAIAETNANVIDTITIVNHYPTVLEFSIENGNPKVTPDLSKQFSLATGSQISSAVTEGNSKEGTQVYIYTHGDEGFRFSAFWAVEKRQIHGYLVRGLAYSWNNAAQATIIFCTKEEFQAQGHC